MLLSCTVGNNLPFMNMCRRKVYILYAFLGGFLCTFSLLIYLSFSFQSSIFNYILLFDSKETIYFIIFCWWNVQKISFILYLHFTWLCGSWKPQRILKKYLFWKYESWFPSEVSKLTSVCYPRKDAFSATKKNIFTNIMS